MRVVVLAHPRSGTGYTAWCFQCGGWDVGHEKIAHDGISSWQWAVKSDAVPWGAPRGERSLPETVLHVMREPAAAISSIAFTETSTEDWRAKWVHIPRDAEPIERAIWSYLGWNLLIQAQGPTHRAQLESIETMVAAMTRQYPLLVPKGHRNDRMHASLSADQIKATPWRYPITTQLWDRVNAMYGEMVDG